MIALPTGPQNGTTLVTCFVPRDALSPVELSDYARGTVVLSAEAVDLDVGKLALVPMWRLLLAVPR